MLGNISAKSKILLVITLLLVAVFLFITLIVVTQEKNEPVQEVDTEVIGEVVEDVIEESHKYSIIGTSVMGRPIELYTFGSGETNVAFVGGIHGGYEWNSVFLAYTFIDYITAYPELIPENISVSIIPNANPDGLFKVVGSGGRFALADIKEEGLPVGTGRFNYNDVDLNRNFDCKWQPESTWRGNVVSAGTSVFSEPEAQAIRDFVYEYVPSAVIFWHSQAGAVYASECENGILPETRTIMNAYASAAGYRAVDVFDSYEITGDAEGWLASIGIPAITVELETHETIEWERNLAGFNSLLQYYTKLQL